MRYAVRIGGGAGGRHVTRLLGRRPAARAPPRRASASTQAGVERGAGLLAQEREGPVGRPRVAVDAVGDERVVDVAGGEDPRAERELGAGQAARVARAVEALVVLADEAQHRRREAAELAQEPDAGLGVALDLGVLLVGQLRRACAGSPRRPTACRRRAAGRRPRGGGASRRQGERLADLHGEQGDAPRMAGRRAVVRAEPDHQGADAGAQVRLLGGDDLGGAEVADERARRAAAAQVERDRDAEQRSR